MQNQEFHHQLTKNERPMPCFRLNKSYSAHCQVNILNADSINFKHLHIYHLSPYLYDQEYFCIVFKISYKNCYTEYCFIYISNVCKFLKSIQLHKNITSGAHCHDGSWRSWLLTVSFLSFLRKTTILFVSVNSALGSFCFQDCLLLDNFSLDLHIRKSF